MKCTHINWITQIRGSEEQVFTALYSYTKLENVSETRGGFRSVENTHHDIINVCYCKSGWEGGGKGGPRDDRWWYQHHLTMKCAHINWITQIRGSNEQPYIVTPNLRREVASDQLKTPIMTSSMVLVFTIPVLGMSCKAYQLLLATCDCLLLTLPLVN